MPRAPFPLMPLGLLLLASCGSGPIASVKPLKLEKVPEALESARNVDLAALESRPLAKTVARLMSVLRTPQIETADRAQATALLERSAQELATRGTIPDDLEDLAMGALPSRIAVPAGLRGAQLLLEDDERSDAYRLLQRIDQRYPSHAFRDEAGDLLWTIGESYANDTGRRLFLFPYANRAPAVFEYLSSEYPTHEQTDDALVRLAELYAEDRLFDIAIEKHRELVLWAPDSPFRVRAESEIPRLRLADLDGPAYDRDAMLLALEELENWIATYPSHELRPEVDRTLVDCLQRLADNDLIVAKFYRRVKSPEGARQHAARALGFAKRAGNPEQEAEILEMLASVNEIERADAPIILDESINDEFRGDAGLGLTGPAGLSDSLPTTPRRPEDRVSDEPDEADDSGDDDGGSQ